MEEKTSSQLRQRRKRLLPKAAPVATVLRGSLIERYKPCGKPGCKCARGRGHGPKYYLSVSRPGSRPDMDYVPQDRVEQVRRCLSNFRKIQAALDQLCAINRELLRRREPL